MVFLKDEVAALKNKASSRKNGKASSRNGIASAFDGKAHRIFQDASCIIAHRHRSRIPPQRLFSLQRDLLIMLSRPSRKCWPQKSIPLAIRRKAPPRKTVPFAWPFDTLALSLHSVEWPHGGLRYDYRLTKNFHNEEVSFRDDWHDGSRAYGMRQCRIRW